ncbi:MAG: DUF3800 domain-containing protein [Caulobacter sp.]|nr:DUF3800 domain-containing protein [Caulobacter sp.]
MVEFSDYIVFADESGDHGLEAFSASFPVFVLAFTLVNKAAYVGSIVPSLQQLKLDFFGHDQVVLHERDIRRQQHPFGFLRTDATLRDRFLERLNETVAAAEFELVCSVIHKERLKARYATPWNPYEIALLFCMERVRERLLALGQRGRKVHVIFESRGKAEDASLVSAFRRLATTHSGWGFKKVDFSVCEWEPLIVPKSVNSSGLQLADLAARPVGLHSMRPSQSNRAFDVLRPKLKALKAFP